MPAITHLLVKRRIAAIFIGAAIFIALLVLRMFWLQVVQNYFLTENALRQRMRPVPVEAKRGVIFDRNMEKLAVSVSADAVYAVPIEVREPEKEARILADKLQLDYEWVWPRLKMKQAMVWIKKRITGDEAREIRKMNLPGIGVVENPQRFYPNGSLAASILGIAGIDNQGLEGLEVYYDKYLKGVPGQVVAERDARGVTIPGGLERYVPPQDGDSLVLTIDKVIQYIAERELKRAVVETGSKKGAILVMDPMTGEMLAMASYPGFDPNSYGDFPSSARRNFVVSDQYEPGSTFKIVTASSALEEGVVTPESRFFDPGFITIDGVTMRCWRDGGHGSQSFVEATENSCNPVFAQLGMELGPERFYKRIAEFGFGQPTGIDFPGEAGGILNKPGSVQRVSWATTGFGQGISVTPLQLLNAAATIANGGKVLRPHLAREIRSPDGKVVESFKPEATRQAISAQTAETMRRILRSVVVNGSGKRADVSGYRVAGKTGTAQVPEGGHYVPGKVVASFVGFAPFDDPKVAVLVALYEPTTGVTYGGVIAAPVFAAVVSDIMEYMRIPPKVTADDVQLRPGEEPGPPAPAAEDVVVPNVKSSLLEEARRSLDEAGLKWQTVGEGQLVADQIPKSGAKVQPGVTVLLYLSPGGEGGGAIPGEPLPGETFGVMRGGTAEPAATNAVSGVLRGNQRGLVTVPDLTGSTMAVAAEMLGDFKLRLRIRGSGFAASQTPRPGSLVSPGTEVVVEFAPPWKQ